MTKEEFDNEIIYYFTKRILKELKLNGILSQAEYDTVLMKIKVDYKPYFDLLSD